MVVSQHIDGYVYLIGVSNKRAAIKAEKVAKEEKEREKQAKLLEEEEKLKKEVAE
jgi:predicted GIY-YIG superfamily endonuclease